MTSYVSGYFPKRGSYLAWSLVSKRTSTKGSTWARYENVYVCERCKHINVNDMQINFRTVRFGLMFMTFANGHSCDTRLPFNVNDAWEYVNMYAQFKFGETLCYIEQAPLKRCRHKFNQIVRAVN